MFSRVWRVWKRNTIASNLDPRRRQYKVMTHCPLPPPFVFRGRQHEGTRWTNNTTFGEGPPSNSFITLPLLDHQTPFPWRSTPAAARRYRRSCRRRSTMFSSFVLIKNQPPSRKLNWECIFVSTAQLVSHTQTTKQQQNKTKQNTCYYLSFVVCLCVRARNNSVTAWCLIQYRLSPPARRRSRDNNKGDNKELERRSKKKKKETGSPVERYTHTRKNIYQTSWALVLEPRAAHSSRWFLLLLPSSIDRSFAADLICSDTIAIATSQETNRRANIMRRGYGVREINKRVERCGPCLPSSPRKKKKRFQRSLRHAWPYSDSSSFIRPTFTIITKRFICCPIAALIAVIAFNIY